MKKLLSLLLAAVILWRLNGSPVVNQAMDFADVSYDAWYTEAIRWALSEGIAGGYGNGTFGSADTLTREQMVTMLYRYASLQKTIRIMKNYRKPLPFTTICFRKNEENKKNPSLSSPAGSQSFLQVFFISGIAFPFKLYLYNLKQSYECFFFFLHQLSVIMLYIGDLLQCRRMKLRRWRTEPRTLWQSRTSRRLSGTGWPV